MGQDVKHAGNDWLKGAAVLGAAAAVSKLLGTLQKIPLQNAAGDGAFGIYSAVYPFYSFVVFLAAAGFPAAVSVFVAERLAEGDDAGASRVLKVAAALLAITGVAGFAALYWGADVIAGWIGHGETASAVRSVSFALLIVPLMSALRGYFQGGGMMMPTAVSQVAEQSVRVLTMVAVLVLLTMRHMTDAEVAAGVMLGSATGAAAGMAVMLAYWCRHRGYSRPSARSANLRPAADAEPAGRLAVRLLRYAVPVCLAAVAVPLLGVVDTFTLPRLFQAMASGEAEAMSMFGVYARGLPLIQLAAMLVSAAGAALVPAVAEAKARGDWQAVRERSELFVRLTWLTGAAASIGLAAAALSINRMLYADGQGTAVMAVLAFSALFGTLGITFASVLQGLGRPALPAVSFLIAAGVKTGLNLALVPVLGLIGAALSGVIAYAAAALINGLAVRRLTGIRLSAGLCLWRPALALLGLAAAAGGCSAVLPPLLDGVWTSERWVYTVSALSAVCLGAAVYAAALLKLRTVTIQELRILKR